MSKNINVPQLRFSEFGGEWEEKKLGDIGEIVTGKTPSTTDIDLWNGDIRFITPTDIDDNVKYQSITQRTVVKQNKMKVLPIGSIVYTCIASIGKMQLTLHPSITNQQINSIIVNINHNNEFIYYSLLNMTPYIKSTQSNTTLPIINKTEFSKFIVGIPSIQEQEKIASFLTSVDTKIEQLTKKEALLQEYKKGVMAKIFNQEIRFKAEDGSEFPEWEDSLLGDVLDYIQPTKYLVKDTEYDNSYNIPVLTAGKTFVLGYTNETDGIFENNLPVIIFDDFTTANKFVDFPFKAKSSAMKILIPKNNNNIKFIYETMQMIKYEVGGHERHWISKFTFLNVFMPCLEEQTKIANFLSSIDKKIELATKELHSTKEFKKALLQQMFV